MKSISDVYVKLDEMLKRFGRLDAVYHGVYWNEELLRHDLLLTATTVEGVRCKECKRYIADKYGDGTCDVMVKKHHDYEFCSFGERMAEDE